MVHTDDDATGTRPRRGVRIYDTDLVKGPLVEPSVSGLIEQKSWSEALNLYVK